ncbi:cytochrome P450 [Pisolithus marmoratus]|nr:cytochrome P450 [Pisolithus marmoratus]
MASIDTLVVIISAFIALSFVLSHFRRSSAEEYPPVVPSFLPYIGSSFQYARNPSEFLWSRCKAYGPAFKTLIGGRQVTVISSPDGIAAILRNPHNTLKSNSIQVDVIQAVAGFRDNAPHLQEILHHQLSPMAGRTLAKISMRKFTTMYVEQLLQEMNVFVTRFETGEKTLSLMEIVGRCRIAALCHAIFGPSFANDVNDVYDDMKCLDGSVYARLYRIPYYWPPSSRARKRLLVRLSTYITRVEEGSALGDVMLGIMDILKENKLAIEDVAWMLLVFFWGLFANSTNMTFWALSEILADEKLAARLRAGIDGVLLEHGYNDLPALLRANAHALDGLSLLDSVVQETIRLRLISTPSREASCDTELVVDAAAGRRVVIRKGEYVMAHLMGTHWEERWYEQSHKFVPDRFVSEKYASGLGTDDDKSTRPKETRFPFFAWGGGREICKGRHLSVYEIKLLVALCVHHLRIAPADSNKHGLESTNSLPPRAKKQSIGVKQPEHDVMVQLNLAE